MVLSMILLPFSFIALSKCSLFSHRPKPIPFENPLSSFRILTRKRFTLFSLKNERKMFSSIQQGTPPMKIQRSFLFSIANFFFQRSYLYYQLSVSSRSGRTVHSERSIPLNFGRCFFSFQMTTSVRYFNSSGMLNTTPFQFSYFCIPFTDSYKFLGNYQRRKFHTYFKELNSTSISSLNVTYPGIRRCKDFLGYRLASSNSNSLAAISYMGIESCFNWAIVSLEGFGASWISPISSLLSSAGLTSSTISQNSTSRASDSFLTEDTASVKLTISAPYVDISVSFKQNSVSKHLEVLMMRLNRLRYSSKAKRMEHFR